MKSKYIHHRENLNKFKESIFDNFSYKVVSLIIALILWVSLLNKRDFIATKEFDIDIVTAQNLVIMAQTNDKLRVKVSGPQPLLKKFKTSSQIIAFDMSDKPAGFYDIDVSTSKIEVPKGLKVIAIRPNTIRVEISENLKDSK
jgi:YbbR domain-containing protein